MNRPLHTRCRKMSQAHTHTHKAQCTNEKEIPRQTSKRMALSRILLSFLATIINSIFRTYFIHFGNDNTNSSETFVRQKEPQKPIFAKNMLALWECWTSVWTANAEHIAPISFAIVPQFQLIIQRRNERQNAFPAHLFCFVGTEQKQAVASNRGFESN